MFKVRIIYCGSLQGDEYYHFYGMAPGHIIDIPIYSYLLEEGPRKILVDSACEPPATVLADKGIACDTPLRLDEILKREGVDPREIDMILYTHLHWDHAGNMDFFPNAALCCQADEMEKALTPSEWEGGYSRALAPTIQRNRHRFQLVEGDHELLPGLRVVNIGGHTLGSQAVIVTTENGRVALPGDTLPRYRNLEEHLPTGLYEDLAQATAAIDRVRRLADVVLPSHDWLAMSRFAGVINRPLNSAARGGGSEQGHPV